ncbi:MAG: PH domain-containing protein [Acidobacteriota bacterium]|nr:PH domain-containing protein [Acidobacteriota bacterium]
MKELIVRPSMKTVWAGYVFAAIVFIAGTWAYYRYLSDQPLWLTAIPLVAFLPPLRVHIRRKLVGMRLFEGHLTVESGFFTRTRRTVDVAKIQDVTFTQTLGQRLLGVGDLRFESAGESGSMGMRNVDRPRQIADLILEVAKRAAAARGAGIQ